MFKKGFQPQSFPINDELVKNLNLRLAQKNMLIEQFHRSLMHFQETVTRENIQLSQHCSAQFTSLVKLI